MRIDELARNRSKLENLTGFIYLDPPHELAAISLRFEGNNCCFLSVECDSDSLNWAPAATPDVKEISLDSIFPMLRPAKGLLAWAWEMTNHQGYFDALQIELCDASLKNGFTVQFKAVASKIDVFEVVQLRVSPVNRLSIDELGL